jgi:glycosyltransferase involved in cell wall biosynthesis
MSRVVPKNWPLVSVILTVHNAERYISEAVASVLSQSYSNLELLVVDDASTDRTPQILKDLCVSDRRARVFTLGQNVGTYVAKSFAASFARGEMLTCHDADDLATPEWISQQMEPLLRAGNCVATISDWFRVSESGALLPGSSRDVHPVESKNHTSLLFRREILERMGPWDSARVLGDVEFYERLRNVYGHRAVVSVRRPLVVGLHRAESLMNDSTVGLTESNTEQLRRHLTYRESWVNWHVDCLRHGRVPRMPSVLSRIRPFRVPREFRVSPGLIREAYSKLSCAVREDSYAS